MNKTLILTATIAAVVLAGCSPKEKDAEYYYNHPKELKTLKAQCDAKAKSIDEKVALNPSSDIYNDQNCIIAYRAYAGIKMKSLKKAIAEEPSTTDQPSWWARHILSEVYGWPDL